MSLDAGRSNKPGNLKNTRRVPKIAMKDPGIHLRMQESAMTVTPVGVGTIARPNKKR